MPSPHPASIKNLRAAAVWAGSWALVAAAGCAADSAPARLEVGTGSGTFQSVASGATVPIVCGPQGGQHVWMSLRAQNLEPGPVDFLLTLQPDEGLRKTLALDPGEPLCGQQRSGLSLPVRDGWAVYAGAVCYIANPEVVAGRTLTLTGSIKDATGRAVRAQVSVVPVGPEAQCGW